MYYPSVPREGSEMREDFYERLEKRGGTMQSFLNGGLDQYEAKIAHAAKMEERKRWHEWLEDHIASYAFVIGEYETSVGKHGLLSWSKSLFPLNERSPTDTLNPWMRIAERHHGPTT